MTIYQLFIVIIFKAVLFAEIPEATLRKMPPMVEIYHPVSTRIDEAQKSFDRGLTYIFAFNHDLAFAYFEKASKLDPDLAMAYWGMALALGQNMNQDVTPENELKCYGYIQKALELSPNTSQSEKDYISALAVRYTNDPNADLIPFRFRYREAMKKLIDTYPEDLDAVTMYAESILDLDPWKWWTYEGKPKNGTMEAIEKLEIVLNRNPLHLGANHYYIHAWEESSTPERALVSANRLEFILPESGHLMHMPCHIFLPLGDYEKAVSNSKRALAQDFAYFKEFGLSLGTYPIHYISHNTYVLARTYMLMEDYENAIKTALEAINFIEPYFKIMPQRAHYASIPLEIYLYFHKWKEILDYKFSSNFPSEQAYWHYSRAKAFANLSDLTSAQKEKELLLQCKQEIANDDEIANNPASQVIELAAIDLEATFSHMKKNYPEYIALLNKAVELQDRLNYDEPPAWYVHLRIPLGAALLEQQKYAEAQVAFSKTLNTLQRNGRALFGLFLSLKGQNRVMDAYWIEREMTAALKNSSEQLKFENL